MPLSPGARLGRFEILALLGAGAMGDVYRALDSTLGREVAVKVLPDALAQYPERLARLAREARLLASLNHPNIAAVHALEQIDQMYYLEMELVRGETLAERIGRGAVRLTEALPLFRQIAEALEAAHAQSIVHRDLKPANIMITAQGVVKILDFGLAKVVSSDDSQAQTPSGELVTLTTAPTEAGVVVGTPAYMSPEQARGDTVDRRADVWAFGCVLYEMLTARRAFHGRTASDTIASVLREEPDWAGLATVAPRKVQRLIRRCLQKDPRLRLHDIADARIEIEEALSEPLDDPAEVRFEGVRSRDWMVRTAVWAVVAAGLAGVLGAWAGASWRRSTAPSSSSALTRVMVPLPPGQVLEGGRFTSVALSPDGRLLVYSAAVRGGSTQLYLRRLDELEARPVPGTEGANTPLFSPDGRWLAFYAEGALKKVSLAGGVPLTISEAPPVWSATWAGDNIVFATTLASSGLWLVSADGGEPMQLTKLKGGDSEHGYPQILPGGTQVLFSVLGATGWQPALLSLNDREWRLVGNGRVVGQGAQFLRTGHLVSVQSGGLVATRFDPATGTLDAAPIPLLERIATTRFGGARFAVAADVGSLIYVPAAGGPVSRTLLRVDREGRATPLLEARGGYEHPVVSPDGRQVAVTVASETGSDIWLVDVNRGTRVRFTTGDTSAFPVWAADGSRLAYQSAAPGPSNLFWKPLDQSATAQPLLKGSAAVPTDVWPTLAASLLPGTPPTLTGANPQVPVSWAPDRSALAFHERKPNGERDIWIVGTDGNPEPFLLTPFDERSPRFSPDGKWLAYVSNESGRDEVYVQPFPGPGPKWLISTNGGVDPVWSRDGRDLFYRQEDQVMAVSVITTTSFSAARPRRLFETRFDVDDNAPNYDVSPDGTWFVMPRSDQGSAPAALYLVLDWFGEILARSPAESR
jgi:serine/threonine-protein kinase